MIQTQPTCFERIAEIITAIVMLFAGMSGGSAPPPLIPASTGTIIHTLRPAVSEYSQADLARAAEVILKRMQALGYDAYGDVSVSVVDDVIRVVLPGGFDTTDAYPAMTLRGAVELVDSTGRAIITSADILSAVPQASDMGDWRILVTLTETGGETMRTFSRENIGSMLAIVVEGETISEPIIQSEIGAEIMLAGSFSEPEALALAVRLGSGALPFEMVVESTEMG